MIAMKQTVLKGLALGILLDLVFFAYWHFVLNSVNGTPSRYTSSLPVLMLVVTLITLSTACLGALAGFFRRHRTWKLLGSVTALYWVNAAIVAFLIMISEPGESVSEILLGVFGLSFAALFVPGLILLPVLFLFTLVLAFWTRADMRGTLEGGAVDHENT